MGSCGYFGAGDGTRTHDILLGKQTLYQLSYAREARPVYRGPERESTFTRLAIGTHQSHIDGIFALSVYCDGPLAGA